MTDFRLGDEVLAPWASDGFLYPAIVVQVSAVSAHVAYLDGDEGDVPLATLRQGVLGPGLVVQVNWKGRGSYYGGVIQKRVGQAVFMSYEDGDLGWATIAQCRVRDEVVRQIGPQLMACPYCGSAIDSSLSICPHCGAPRQGRG